jgi:tetratricopeptide (TPR) repeat protein
MFLKVCAAAVLSIALGACAGGERAGTLAPGAAGDAAGDAAGGGEVARFDAARAERLEQDAQAALARGDLAAAEIAFEEALDAWPVSKLAWDGLADIYREQGRQEDLEVAGFFAARMDWVATVPPLIASGAFENAAKGRVEIARDSVELRRRSAQLVDFLRGRDAQARDDS